MNYERQFRFRLLFIFCFLGFANIFLVSQVYFHEGKNSLINRAFSQLNSVCELYQNQFFQIQHGAMLNKNINQLLKLPTGMGHSGEVYLVDSNYRIQSASRFGPKWFGSVIKNQATEEAFQNKSGMAQVKDYRGVDVVSTYGPIQFNNKNYALLCEMDMNEVLAPLYETKKKVLLLSILLIVMTFLASLLFTSKMIQFLKKMKDHISHLNFKIIEAQETERIKIAHEVHDGIGQMVTAIKWRLCMLQENGEHDLQDLVSLCDKTLSEIRTISQNETLSTLKEFGVFATFEEMKNINDRLKGPVILSHIPDEVIKIPFRKGFEMNLYRILQELLQNAIKHSEAESLHFTFSKTHGSLLIDYQDNGIGMSPELFPPKSLAYRVNLFGGTIKQLPVDQGLHLSIEFKLQEICS